MPDHHQPITSFDVALRGYDRDQVDHHLAEFDAEFSATLAERDRLAEGVKRLEQGVEELHLQPAGGHDEDTRPRVPSLAGFGERVEKILRLAEDEATALHEETRKNIELERAEAAKQVGAIRQAAEKDAAAHRRKVEQDAAQVLE